MKYITMLLVLLALTAPSMAGPAEDKVRAEEQAGCVLLDDLLAYYNEAPTWPTLVLSGTDMLPALDAAGVPKEARTPSVTRVIVATSPEQDLVKYSFEVDGCMMQPITVLLRGA